MILAIIVSVFGGVVSAEDVSGGLKQSVDDAEIQAAVGNLSSEELAKALDAVTDDIVNIEFADQSLLLGPVSAASLTVPSFKQCDSRWGANQLGTCSDTICSAGCAVTSVAMILKYYGVATDPGDLNTWLTKNSGYASGCLIIWDKADDRSGGSVQYAGPYDSNIPNQVQWEIDHGYPCVGGLDGHFVVITGYSDSLYYINDPSYSRSTISKSSITKIHTYHGTASGSCTAKFSKGDIVEVNTPGSCLKCYPDGPTSGTPKCEPHGTVGVILDPTPTLAADYCRVKVRYCDGFEGWSAQEYLEGKYIAPSTKFSIGDPVRASTGVKYRSDPPELNELGAVSQGTQGNILAGPKYGAVKDVSGCYWFWKVDYGGGKVGWSAHDYLEKVTPCQHSCWDRSALSGNELAALVRTHFPLGAVTQTGESIRVTAYAVAKAESGGNPSACGDSDNSIGLWQIYTPAHPEYDKCRLFEEDYNAEAAKQISNNGGNWNPWCTWEKTACGGNGNEAYKTYLTEARKHFYPKVNSLSVSSNSISLGESVKIYYSVSDDAGLNRVELLRTIDKNGAPDDSNWNKVKQVSISGTTYSDYFTDTPTSPDIYWYGIHVVDNSGAPEAWNDEKNSRTGNWPGVYGPKKVEVTQPNQPPQITTNAATNVEETTATLNGVINNDGGEACQYRFEYDTNSGEPYAYNTGWTGSKNTGQSFNAAISSLAKGTKYYFRAQAKNSAGTASGSELTFLTKPDAPTIYPISGDLNGDGTDSYGTFDSRTAGFTFNGKTVHFGTPTDLPVMGDWDNDGKDEIGIYRPDNGGGQSEFHLVWQDWGFFSDGASVDAAYRKVIPFGYYPNNIPIAGDWDGINNDDIGGFCNNKFYLYTLNWGSGTATPYGGDPSLGNPGDKPIIGDWDGDGDDDIGVFRSGAETNYFYLDLDLTGEFHECGPYSLGNVGDEPLIGDWDGDGYDNLGVYRSGDNPFHPRPDLPPTPGTPSNPSPSNHATDVSINTNLDWSDCSNTDFYDVYFGTSSPPPYYGSAPTSNYPFQNDLDYNTKYYWKIEAKSNCGGITQGPLWDFTTEEEPNTCDGTDTSCGIYPNCENCNEDDAWYCNGDIKEYRNFFCSGTSCTYTVTSSENCDNYDGWVDTGNTDWVEVNECQEKEQKEQEYRDYYCSGGACTYSVTGTPQWIDTGTTRNKPDGTICGCTASNTLKKCYSGVCTDTGICDSTTCGADVACDGKEPGDSCGGGTCDTTCKCGVQVVGEDYGVFSGGLWFVDTTGDHAADDVFGYGFAGATPLVGDLNQDGTDDIAIVATYGGNYRWFVDTNFDKTADQVFWFGFEGAIPLVGDIG